MFKLQPDPTFAATVQITKPGGVSLPLDLVFKHKGATEIQTFLDNSAGRTDTEMLGEMIASVGASAKAHGQTDADFLALLVENYPASRSDILRTYLRELTESRVKNS